RGFVSVVQHCTGSCGFELDGAFEAEEPGSANGQWLIVAGVDAEAPIAVVTLSGFDNKAFPALVADKCAAAYVPPGLAVRGRLELPVAVKVFVADIEFDAVNRQIGRSQVKGRNGCLV